MNEINKQCQTREKKTTNTDTLITNRKNYKKISGPSLESQLVDQQSNIKEHIIYNKNKDRKSLLICPIIWVPFLYGRFDTLSSLI